MTFVVDGTNGLTFNDATTQSSTATNASNISSGTLGKARLPTGSVLQVVQTNYTQQLSLAGSNSGGTNTTEASQFRCAITLSSASSKVLVHFMKRKTVVSPTYVFAKKVISIWL